jgi:peptidoglycan/LPS O-acetylase OafA/YrhL
VSAAPQAPLAAHARPGHDEDWAVEGLRGLAALLVLAGHYGSAAGVRSTLLGFSFTGVDLFFALSGFVFAPYLFGRPLQPGAYAVRRLFRIYPLYLAALATYAGLRLLHGQPVQYLWQHLLLLHTWQTHEVAFHLNPAFWSLPAELEFYLALPLLMHWVRGARQVALLAALALVLRLALAAHLPDAGAVNTAFVLSVHLPGLLVEFLCGTIAWHFTRRGLAVHWRMVLLVGGLAAWVALAHLSDYLNTLLPHAPGAAIRVLAHSLPLLAAAASAAVIAAVARPPRDDPTLISIAFVATWAGRLSYGVYLFHNAAPTWVHWVAGGPLPGLVLWPASVATTLVVAFVLHLALEAPMRRFGRRLAQSAGGLPAAQHGGG